MNDLIEYARQVVKQHPNLAEDIMDLIQLCNDEIEEGNSLEHEIELCRENIKQLMEEQ